MLKDKEKFEKTWTPQTDPNHYDPGPDLNPPRSDPAYNPTPVPDKNTDTSKE